MEKPSTRLLALSATYRNRPLGSTTMPAGATPRLTGGPAELRSALPPIEKTEMLDKAGLPTNSRFPLGVIAIPGVMVKGRAFATWQVGGGVVLVTEQTGVLAWRSPFAGLMTNPLMLFEPAFSTYRNGAAGDGTTEIGPVPVLKMFVGVGWGMGLVLTGTVSCPFPLFTVSKVTLFPAKLAM